MFFYNFYSHFSLIFPHFSLIFLKCDLLQFLVFCNSLIVKFISINANYYKTHKYKIFTQNIYC